MAGAACTIAAFGRGRPYMAWPRAVLCADEAFALRLDWPARFEQNCCPGPGVRIRLDSPHRMTCPTAERVPGHGAETPARRFDRFRGRPLLLPGFGRSDTARMLPVRRGGGGSKPCCCLTGPRFGCRRGRVQPWCSHGREKE
jgi:hypothetical protein